MAYSERPFPDTLPWDSTEEADASLPPETPGDAPADPAAGPAAPVDGGDHPVRHHGPTDAEPTTGP